MKNLYRLQTLLVVLLSSVIPSWTIAQFADPIEVTIKNSGATYSDQFGGSTLYAWGIEVEASAQLGDANIMSPDTDNLMVVFTPNPGAIGTTDFIVSYYSLTAPMHPITRMYRFHVVNEVIITGNDKFVIDSGATNVILNVLDNDSVATGELSISTVSISNDGDAQVSSDGKSILFTPNPDFTGDTWIQYIACDSFGTCGQGKVHLLVRDPNVEDHFTYTKYLLNSEQLEVLTPFSDFQVETSPANGILITDNATGWTYTPNEDFIGTDTFKLNLLDLVTREYFVTVYTKPTNTHARNDKFYVRPGLSVTFNVLNNDLLNYEVDSRTNPTRGVLSEVSNGVYTYTPIPGYRGVDKFTYKTCFEDTVYCETATVFIHVTDLEPDNVFTYKLQTSKELPLTIDYPIEYTDFSYIISQNPTHGALVNYAGFQQIDLPCDTIESFNMLVYEPAPGYTGPDHFEYYYCIDASNICYLVKVDMNVIDHPESEDCPCAVGCVWPGDADKDGRVDMSDLLTLGNRLGETGTSRNYNDPSFWFGQHADQWFVGSGDAASVHHMDGNGDGTITAADVDQISTNYFKTHDIIARDVNQKLPYQFSIVPVQFSLDSGDLIILDIVFGNTNNPVLDMKGAKFSVNLPPAAVDSSSVEVEFLKDSWLAEGSPYVSLSKVPWDGRIDAGFARANDNGASGYGPIATVVFIIEDDIEGFKTNDGTIELPVTLHAGSAMDSDGTLFDIEGDEFILTYKPYSSNLPEYKLLVYPNPAQDFVEIHLNGKTTINSVTIIDTHGRVVKDFNDIDQKHHQVDVSSIPEGLYYLSVRHEHGVITHLISVIK